MSEDNGIILQFWWEYIVITKINIHSQQAEFEGKSNRKTLPENLRETI